MSLPPSAPIDAEPGEQHITLNGDIYNLPTFTMKQIYDAIPPHCFQPSILRSMAYVARDFFYLGTLIYLSTTYIPLLPSSYLRFMAWTVYTIIAGMVMTGVWILAHECGHGGFSKNKQLNNLMGLIMHSFLLVPFHSWKITHSAHHKSTGNIEKDTAFVPHTRESWVKTNVGKDADPSSIELAHLAEDAPIVTLWYAFVHQVFGWPGYLLFNLTGQEYDVGFPQYSHFYFGRDSPFFKPEQLRLIMVSDVGVGLMLALLGLCVRQFGWWNVAVLYAVPYLWVNHWIVAITFLQHTDGSLPHYSNSTWTFARGATATIDRDLGFIDTHLFHDIIGTHVCHHLVSTIPFYHAGEASIAIRKVMRGDYRADENMGSTGALGLGNYMGVPAFMTAFWNNMRNCRFVEESVEGSGVYFFRNLHGKGAPPKDLTGGQAAKIKGGKEMRERRESAGAAASTAMSSSRNLNAKRRLSHGLPAVPAPLPLLSE